MTVDDVTAEFKSFLKENFSPEKQEAIIDILYGSFLVFTSELPAAEAAGIHD